MFKRILKEQGFTLIELLVVILIIGILLAVAAPSFLNQTSKANVSVVKQRENTVYSAAKAIATEDGGTYLSGSHNTEALTVAAIITNEPELNGTLCDTTAFSVGSSNPCSNATATAGGAPGANQVSIEPGTASTTFVATAVPSDNAGKVVYSPDNGPDPYKCSGVTGVTGTNVTC